MGRMLNDGVNDSLRSESSGLVLVTSLLFCSTQHFNTDSSCFGSLFVIF